MNILDEKMELWRRAANPNCEFCYGRGFVRRLVNKKQMIDRCQCTENKKDITQKINDGEIQMQRGIR